MDVIKYKHKDAFADGVDHVEVKDGKVYRVMEDGRRSWWHDCNQAQVDFAVAWGWWIETK